MNGHNLGTLDPRSQSGSAVLSIVVVLGVVMLLIQGSTWYRASEGAKFMGKEKKKVVAMQMAEAGVEENIADLAQRTMRPAAGDADVVTYNQKVLDGGRYTSTLSTVGVGSAADTVDVVSHGTVGSMQQTVRARLKLNKYLDTALTVLTYVEPDTTANITTVNVADTIMALPPDPIATPALNTTAAYASCLGGASPTCQVCHLPAHPSPAGRMVLTHPKAVVGSHNSHIGDYVTLDGTCDYYDTTMTFTSHTELDTTYTIVDMNVYDTVSVVDTSVKVQVLSWR